MQVGHPNGAVVPVDEPAVAAARADHLNALAATHGVAHAVAPAVPAVAHAAPVVATGYAGPLNLNTALVGHPNGAVVPVDEPAVAAARADHLAAVGAHVAPVAVAPAVPAVAPVAAPVVATGYLKNPNIVSISYRVEKKLREVVKKSKWKFKMAFAIRDFTLQKYHF